jgi:hypothetical protein
MADKSSGSSNVTQLADWNAAEQNLLAATLSATPAQRLAWLEEALRLAFASGALSSERYLPRTIGTRHPQGCSFAKEIYPPSLANA